MARHRVHAQGKEQGIIYKDSIRFFKGIFVIWLKKEIKDFSCYLNFISPSVYFNKTKLQFCSQVNGKIARMVLMKFERTTFIMF